MGHLAKITLLIILVALCASCTAIVPRAARFDDPFIDARHTLVRMIGQEAELVFVGTVISVGPPPPAWSGKMRARQAVAFGVERVLKGLVPGPTVTVYEPVVANSRLAASTVEPGLSPTLFRSGNRLIVFARKGIPPETFDGTDENVGVIPSSPQNDVATEFALGLLP